MVKSKDDEFESMIAMFENKFKTLQKVIEEKDLLIFNMETKIQKIGENVNSLDEKVEQLKHDEKTHEKEF